jgi:hypothetical protein
MSGLLFGDVVGVGLAEPNGVKLSESAGAGLIDADCVGLAVANEGIRVIVAEGVGSGEDELT